MLKRKVSQADVKGAAVALTCNVNTDDEFFFHRIHSAVFKECGRDLNHLIATLHDQSGSVSTLLHILWPGSVFWVISKAG